VTGAIVADGAAKVTIVDDDLPLLSLGGASITEGNSGTKYAVFTATLSKPSSTPVQFEYYSYAYDQSVFGTATPDVDFDQVSRVVTTIPAGQLSTTISIPVYGDTLAEPNEKFSVRLDYLVGADPGTVGAYGTILNDDVPSITLEGATIDEGNSGSKLMSFTARLSSPTSAGVYFDVATLAQGTATPGEDYAARSLANVGIPPGQTTAVFKVGITGDTKSEDHENFLVALANVRGATEANGTATGWIGNDDPVVWRIADATLVEGNSGTRQMNFVLTLSAPFGSDVTIDARAFGNAGETAQVGTDYASAYAVVKIPSGRKSAVFSVPIIADTVAEPNEVFVVTLALPSQGLGIADGAARGTITNDD
jgi:hypothetical protein